MLPLLRFLFTASISCYFLFLEIEMCYGKDVEAGFWEEKQSIGIKILEERDSMDVRFLSEYERSGLNSRDHIYTWRGRFVTRIMVKCIFYPSILSCTYFILHMDSILLSHTQVE